MLGIRSRADRRRGVVCNYCGVLLLAAIFCVGEYGTWNSGLIAFAVVALLLTASSFGLVYGRSGLWKLAHAHTDELDERQLQVTHASFRRSYFVFGAVSFVVLVFLVLSVRFSWLTLTHRGHYSFGIVALFGLNYLAQILPASILAWREKRVPSEV